MSPLPSVWQEQVPGLPEKDEKEMTVSGRLSLLKAATLNLGQRSGTLPWEGSPC